MRTQVALWVLPGTTIKQVHHSQGSQGFSRRFGAGWCEGGVWRKDAMTHFSKKLGMQLN